MFTCECRSLQGPEEDFGSPELKLHCRENLLQLSRVDSEAHGQGAESGHTTWDTGGKREDSGK